LGNLGIKGLNRGTEKRRIGEIKKAPFAFINDSAIHAITDSFIFWVFICQLEQDKLNFNV
jgi:hypothetical protein